VPGFRGLSDFTGPCIDGPPALLVEICRPFESNLPALRLTRFADGHGPERDH
jgi:hypothetical protein